MVPCICINDSDKPSVIPQEKWVKAGEPYHITIVIVTAHPNQIGIQGCGLFELPLTGCDPYEWFRLNRFAFDLKDIPALLELIKNSTELNDLDIKQLIESSELVINE